MLDKYKKFYMEVYCTISDPKNDYKTEQCVPKVFDASTNKWRDIDLTNYYETETFKKYLKENHNLIVTIHNRQVPSKLTKFIWFIEDLAQALKETIEGILPYA